MSADQRYGANQYARVAMVSSTPYERLDKLYTGAIRFARQGRREALNGEEDMARHCATKLIAIIRRLEVCLDHRMAPALSANLARLYVHIQARLAQPDTSLSPDAFEEALNLLNTLWDGFQTAERQPKK
jgi:flagellar biosynthetic protein FliS